MSSSRLVRGAKTRMFAIVCLICVLGAVVFVFHGTQTKLSEVQKLVNNCNQQQESLSAQLQVIFEYKVRLEKSLTKEKEDHKQTKETLEEKLRDEKLYRERDNNEALNKKEALIQQNKLLQNQLDELKESEKNQVNKLSDDNNRVQRELDQLRKENEDLREQNVQQEDLKAEFLKKKDEIKALEKEIENFKTRPENEQKSYLDRDNTQFKDEIERLKNELGHCEASKKVVEKPKQESPNTNVGDMPKFVFSGQKVTNGSTTPGLNPDAVNNFDVSSPKPVKDVEAQVAKKRSDQIAQPVKKPTQESVMPLAFPQQQQQQLGLDQIPVPVNGHEPQGNEHNPQVNTIQKPNTGNAGQAEEAGPFAAIGGGEPDVDHPKLFAPAPLEEEDNFQKQGEIPRIKNGENYPHGGDYERDQPEDEEDDEGEQPDYDERAKKEQKNMAQQQPLKNAQVPIHEQGVMVNPK